MVNWWFGILGISRSNNPFHKGILRKPNHQSKPPSCSPHLRAWLLPKDSFSPQENLPWTWYFSHKKKYTLMVSKSSHRYKQFFFVFFKHLTSSKSRKGNHEKKNLMNLTTSYNYFTKEGTCAPPKVSTHRGEFSSNARYIKCCKNLGIQLALTGQWYFCFFCLIFIHLNPVEPLPKNKISRFFWWVFNGPSYCS